MSKEIEDLKKQIMWLQNPSLFNRQEALRDHFAGLALQGLLASPKMGDPDIHDSAKEWIKDITESAYEFADAMLAEREKNMNLFNLKNTDAYTIDLKELLDKNIGISSNNIIHILIPSVGEITFNRSAAKFLVEQLQFYIGEDDDN